MKNRISLLVFVTVLALTFLACQSTATPTMPPVSESPVRPTHLPTQAPTIIPPTDVVGQQEMLVALYDQVSPGVVTIRAFTPSGGALGTGWVYNMDGYIVTNYHVVEDAEQLEVDFPSGLKVFGSVAGTDLDSDLAIIKVDVPADELHPLTLGDSDALKVGQTVVAIGNPYGLRGSMTMGIVSALGRTLPSINEDPEGNAFIAGDVIQTDASLNPGNSGGPLLNLDAEVVGVNRAIRTQGFTEQGEPINSGIGFAISVNIVKRVVPALIESGHFGYPDAGFEAEDDLTLYEINVLGLKSYSGAYVTKVFSGGPAERAGLRAGHTPTEIEGLMAGGDLIIAIDGQTVLTYDDVLRYLFLHKSPGDKIVLTVLRGDGQLDLTINLVERP